MEKQIKILKSWLETSTKFFVDNYAEIFAIRSYNEVLETNEEQELHREGVSYHTQLARFIKVYLKAIKGAELTAKEIKRIENLPNFGTTHPNLLMR